LIDNFVGKLIDSITGLSELSASDEPVQIEQSESLYDVFLCDVESLSKGLFACRVRGFLAPDRLSK
jgi:hypothetical protein